MEKFDYKKTLGQNFLKDDNITSKIANSASIDKETLIVEIGPGAGALSQKIIPLCGYAILYEIDERLRDTLKTSLSKFNNYEIIFGDFLKQDISKIRKKYHYNRIYVVANLPYYITTAIITKLLKELYPDKIIVMVQDEVASRLSASKGSRDYGMISVLLGAKYKISKLFKVSRNCFFPVPNVDSAIVKFEKNDILGDVNFDKFTKLVQDAFQFKRKNLKNNLKRYDLAKFDLILAKRGYSLQTRAEEIDVETFIEMTKVI